MLYFKKKNSIFLVKISFKHFVFQFSLNTVKFKYDVLRGFFIFLEIKKTLQVKIHSKAFYFYLFLIIGFYLLFKSVDRR